MSQQTTTTNRSRSKYRPLRDDDKARRPYALNMDWLQLYCWRTDFFVPNTTSAWGYTTEKLDYGSKYWKEIYNVYDPDGVLIGQLTCNPHKKEVNKATAMLKIENSLLYEADCMDRVFSAIQGLGLKYKGISRIDLAYDCNELYNGLSISNLVWRYLDPDGNYIKLGQNKCLLYADMRYHARAKKSEGVELWSKDPRPTKAEQEAEARHMQEQREACRQAGLPEPTSEPAHLVNNKKFHVSSITWGMRSAAVQVQIYDKSAELRERRMKHHIVKSWKDAGLDITRPVYRIEIRITSRGKVLLNLETGKYYILSVNEILCQQQLEQLFFDYAEKYLCFYIKDKDRDVRKSRYRRLRILSLNNQYVSRPKAQAFSKDYSRSALIALHELNRLIVENQRAGNEITATLKAARQYMEDVHDLRAAESAWMAKDLALAKVVEGACESISAEEYFEQRLKGAPHELAARAAAARTQIERSLAAIAEQRAQERAQKLSEHLRWGGTYESFIAMQQERAPDFAIAEYNDLARLTPTLERPDFDTWAKLKMAERQELLKRLEEPAPPPDIPKELTDAQRQELIAAYDEDRLFTISANILEQIQDCPF